jgi:hypothetical protein
MAFVEGKKSGDYRISPGLAAAYPEAANTKMVKLQQKDYEDRFAPIESGLLTEVQTQRGEAQAQSAGEDVAQQASLSRGSFLRNLSRTNTSLTQRQKGTISRKEGLSAARGIATAKNLTRRTITDQNIQRTGELIGIGRNIQQGASQGIGEASSLAAQRETALKQAQSAHKAQNLNTVATIGGAALGIAAMFI